MWVAKRGWRRALVAVGRLVGSGLRRSERRRVVGDGMWGRKDGSVGVGMWEKGDEVRRVMRIAPAEKMSTAVDGW